MILIEMAKRTKAWDRFMAVSAIKAMILLRKKSVAKSIFCIACYVKKNNIKHTHLIRITNLISATSLIFSLLRSK